MTKRSSTGDGMLTLFRLLHSRFRQDQVGAALVEMTLITPFMLVLAAGVFEFSNIIQTKLLIEAGVRDGARYFARCYKNDVSTPDCEGRSMNIATTGQPGDGGTARVSNWTDVSVDYETKKFNAVNEDTGNKDYLSIGQWVRVVQVTASYPYSGTGLWTYLGFGPLTLTAAHEERVMGN